MGALVLRDFEPVHSPIFSSVSVATDFVGRILMKRIRKEVPRDELYRGQTIGDDEYDWKRRDRSNTTNEKSNDGIGIDPSMLPWLVWFIVGMLAGLAGANFL